MRIGYGKADGTAMDDSEDTLIRRCQQGDTDAFGVLVKRYAGRATGAAVALVGNRPDALDVSQEAFVRAWRHIGSFRGQSTFFAWYSRILRNASMTWLRRRHNCRDVELVHDWSVPAGEADPAVLAEQNDQKRQLWQAILKLPTKHREIIVMRHFQDLSYREIAEVLEIPVGTVMSRLHSARQSLRTQLLGVRP